MNRPTVLFLGSFKQKTKDGATGGQTFASMSLVNSSLSNKINWIKIDTTPRTSKRRSLITRLIAGVKRLFKLLFILIVRRPDFTLLFVSQGWGFKEKALMAQLAKIFSSKVLLAPRSGLVENHIKKNKNFISIIETALKHTDFLICQSQYWKDFYSSINQNPNLQYKIINNWVNIEHYKNWIANKSNRKSKKDEFVVLFLGSVTKNKGVFDLIEAFKKITDQSIKLHLCGNGDEIEDVKYLIEKYNLEDRVKLIGWVHGETKMKNLDQADVFILPSYKEGFPNALLEAMACDLPTISTNIRAISDIVEHMKTGYLVNPGMPDEIVEAIEWYKNNPDRRKEISQNALLELDKRNSIKYAVSQFEEIFMSK